MNLKKIYDTFILVLSLYVVIVLSIDIISNWTEETRQFFDRIDFYICLIFLGDWFYFFWKAENKRVYTKSRLIDLLSSIPYADIFRGLRIFRIVRITRSFRLLRGLKGFIPIIRFIANSKRRSALSIYLTCTIIIYFYCSLGIYNFEFEFNDKINNFGDALWLSFTTLTTVGYGDMYPITTGGRIMAAIMVIIGMGMFSLVTAEFAAIFLNIIREENKQKY